MSPSAPHYVLEILTVSFVFLIELLTMSLSFSLWASEKYIVSELKGYALTIFYLFIETVTPTLDLIGTTDRFIYFADGLILQFNHNRQKAIEIGNE